MSYKKVFLIMNEQHSLLEDQERVLEEKFADAEIEKISVPAEGWTLQEMNEAIRDIYLELVEATPKFPDNPKMGEFYDFTYGRKPTAVVFVSPIPYMIKRLTQLSIVADIDGACTFMEYGTFIFHNDKREKKELPNGKIIYTVAQEGWQLV